MPDEQEGFVAGWIVKEEGDVSTVALESGEQVRTDTGRGGRAVYSHPS